MKKLFLLVLCCTTFQIANSQVFEDRSRSAVFGFRAGYSLATWRGLVYDIPGIEYTTISGFHGGIFTNIRIGDAIALEPGAYYSMKGWKATGSFEDNTGTLEGSLTNKISYLDMPLLFRFYIKGLNFGAGPQASLILKSTVDAVGELNQVPFSDSEDTTVDLNDFDFALVLSFGYEFDFGLSLHATYDLGLSNNVVLSPYQTWDEGNNRVLKFSIGMVIY